MFESVERNVDIYNVIIIPWKIRDDKNGRELKFKIETAYWNVALSISTCTRSC